MANKRARTESGAAAPAPRKSRAKAAPKSKVISKYAKSGIKSQVKKGSRMLAPRSMLTSAYFDARIPRNTCIHPAPSLGNYTPVSVKARATVNVNTSIDKVLLMGFSTSGLACAVVDVHTGNPAHGKVTPINFNELIQDAPQSLRGSRKTITIGTSTASQDVAGAIYVTMVPQSIQLEPNADATNYADHLSPASADALLNIARQSTNSKQFSTQQFTRNPAFSLGFASYTVGSEYQAWNTLTMSSPPTAAEERAALNQMIEDLKLGAMSTLVVALSHSSSAQTFEIGMYEQVATRYPANHLLAGLQRQQGGGPPSGFQAANAAQASQARASTAASIPVP